MQLVKPLNWLKKQWQKKTNRVDQPITDNRILSMLCSYEVAVKLKKHHVNQDSLFYWHQSGQLIDKTNPAYSPSTANSAYSVNELKALMDKPLTIRAIQLIDNQPGWLVELTISEGVNYLTRHVNLPDALALTLLSLLEDKAVRSKGNG